MTGSTESQLTVRLPWQARQWQRLEQLRGSGRLPHALLLSGPPGIGKGRFARALAHYLMCEQPQSGTACGQCRQCGFNRAGTHPDFKWVEPESTGRQIKVDQVREVVEFLGHTAQQGGYKITAIQPAEAMNINAANALLKSLEEPAGNTLLVLITDSPSRLLATIRSRCQALLFPIPERAQALEWLTPLLGPEASTAGKLLAEAQGRPMLAMDLLQSGGLERVGQLDADFLAMLEGGVGPLAIAEKWLAFELADILGWLSLRLSALIAAAMAGGEMPAAWAGLAARVDCRAVYRVLDRVGALQQQLYRGTNPNRQLALEDLLLLSCDRLVAKNP